MITKEMEKAFSDRFNGWRKRPDAPKLKDPDAFKACVLDVFARDEDRQRSDRNAYKALKDALRHTKKAIAVLATAHGKNYSNRQSRHLLDLLENAYRDAGEPKDSGEIHKSYYHAASDTWLNSTLTPTVKKTRSPSARLIFDLEALWFSEFQERPNTSDEPKFYIFAGDMMAIDPHSVRRQRDRTVPPEKTDSGE